MEHEVYLAIYMRMFLLLIKCMVIVTHTSCYMTFAWSDLCALISTCDAYF